MCATLPRSYPREFGEAFARLEKDNLTPMERFMDFEGEDSNETLKWFWRKIYVDEDLWDDAKMTDVLTYLLENRHLHV